MEPASSEPVIAKPKSKQVEEVAAPPLPLIDPIIESQKQSHDWHVITEHITMNFRGKRRSFNEIVTYVRSTCNIGPYPDLNTIKVMEEKVGNLIADIYIQKAKAQYAFGKLEYQRLGRLGLFIESKDRRSASIIEARVLAHDEGYQTVIALQSDCKSTLDFWVDMYNICMRTVDRLKQLSMASMAEMKLSPSDYGGKGN